MMFELETSEKYIVGGENNFSYQTVPPIGKYLYLLSFFYIYVYIFFVKKNITGSGFQTQDKQV